MDDLISRQKAIDAIRDMCEECDSSYCGECRVNFQGLKDCKKVLEGLPTSQPERKKGKWVGYDGDWLKTMCKCSECGAMIDINEKYRNFFCYHCGADMREDIDAV